jgi:hypothetical protein
MTFRQKITIAFFAKDVHSLGLQSELDASGCFGGIIAAATMLDTQAYRGEKP